MVRKANERAQARQLRRNGMSIRSIAETVGVAKSTVSLWVRDIELAPELAATLREADPVASKRQLGQQIWSRQCREERAAAQEHGRRLARAGDPLHRAGCMLYWAEGYKGVNQVAFSNADVAMMRLFVRFLVECYEISPGQIRLTINCFLGNGLSLEEIEVWWLEQLYLQRTSLLPSIVNRPSRASKYRRPQLLYGTARLSVFSTAVQQSLLGAIQEYGGFTREEWLQTDRVRRAAAVAA